jgi:two-component system chemotaxis sensor kinase CheA
MNSVTRLFLQEAQDLVEELDSLLLDFEESPQSGELRDQFMRLAHTFKGSAATVGLTGMADLAHEMEDLVVLLGSGEVAPTPTFFDLLSQGLDALRRGMVSVADGQGEPAGLARVQERMGAWRSGASDAVGEDRDGPRGSGDAGFTFGEYDHIRIKALRERGLAIHCIDVPIPRSVDAPVELGEALIASARDAGEIIVTDPAEWELTRLGGGRGLTVLLGSALDPDELRELMHVSPAGAPRVVPYTDSGGGAVEDTGRAVSSSMLAERTVRVETGDLDDLLRLVGELVTSRARFHTIAEQFRTVLADNESATDIDDSAARLGHIAGELQDGILRARMVPVARLFRALKRETRTAARNHACRARLTTVGDETELDKGVVDFLLDPLGRLVRALVAGQAAGVADDEVTIEITARGTGRHASLEVRSTGEEPEWTELDAIASALSSSGGQLALRRTDGRFGCGITLPTTLAIVSAMLVEVGDEIYALPLEGVGETLKIKAREIESLGGERTIELRGGALSLVILSEVLDAARGPGREELFAVVAHSADRPIGIAVDRLLGKQDIVIKPLGRRFATARTTTGAAILGDGRIALVLDVGALFDESLAPRGTQRTAGLDAWAAAG